jgi:hypothetical protein
VLCDYDFCSQVMRKQALAKHGVIAACCVAVRQLVVQMQLLRLATVTVRACSSSVVCKIASCAASNSS